MFFIENLRAHFLPKNLGPCFSTLFFFWHFSRISTLGNRRWVYTDLTVGPATDPGWYACMADWPAVKEMDRPWLPRARQEVQLAAQRRQQETTTRSRSRVSTAHAWAVAGRPPAHAPNRQQCARKDTSARLAGPAVASTLAPPHGLRGGRRWIYGTAGGSSPRKVTSTTTSRG